MEEVNVCPLCANRHSRFFIRKLFRGQEVINRVCQGCGLVFQSPRMTVVELDAFYAGEYRLLQEGSADPTARNILSQKGRSMAMLDFVHPFLSAVSHHLDIGCSLGILLQQFQATYGCQSTGVEPGDAHRIHAQEQGLTVYPSLDTLEKSGEVRFDLVSMSHVLEHMADPVGYLTHLRESLLTPDGWLLLEVPNLYAHDSFEVAHLIAFSSHTLRQALEQASFEIVFLEAHGRPRSDMIPLYITVLARPQSGAPRTWNLVPEKQIALKRRVGMFRRRVLERLFPRRAWKLL